MKKSLLPCILILSTLLNWACCPKSDIPNQPLGGKETQVCSGFSQLSDSGAKLSSGGQLALKSQSDWWKPMFVGKKGIFKPNTQYKISLSYKISSPSKTLLMLVREDGDTKGIRDIIHPTLPQNSDGSPQSFEIKFQTPNRDISKYSLQLHSLGKFEGSFGDIKISEVEDAYYPVLPNTPKFCGDLGKLPTGSEEFEVELPRPTGGAVVHARDFGITPSCKDFITKLNAAIDHCRKIGAAKLVLEKGDYYITEQKPMLFTKLKDFEFDGSDSTLTFFRKKSNSMTVSDCLRVKIANFNFDWDWSKDPLGAIVQIVDSKRDGKNSYVDFEFVDYKNETYPQRDIRVGHISPIDPKTRSIGVEDGKAASWEMRGKRDDIYRKKWLSGNVLRIYVPENQVFFEKGELYRMNHYYYDMNCTHMSSNKHLTLENINVFSTPGHSFVVSGSQQYWQLLNVNIAIPPNSPKRPTTCTADHFHISRSKGYFKMIDCDFGFGGDDCLNAHDCSLFMRPSGKRTMRTVNGRSIWTIAKGDKVEIRQGDYSPSGMQAIVTDIKQIDAKNKIYEVTFDRDIPEEKFDGFILFNLDYQTRNVILRNCYFHENKARGVLILCKNVTIENCRFFHNESAALKFETGYTFNVWSEGYGVDNVVVRNCKFDTVNSRNGQNDGKLRDIFMGVYMKTDPSPAKTHYPILSNIMFENNEFKNSAGLVAFITSTGNVIFKDNTIINDTPRKNEVSYRGGFWVAYSQNTKIVNNVWIESDYVPKPGVFAETSTTKNLLVAGNRLEEKK